MASNELARTRLGKGARLPRWFWVLFSLSSLGFVIAPLASATSTSSVGVCAVVVPSAVTLVLMPTVARRLRGVGLWSGDVSSRRAAIVLAGAALLGNAVTLFLVAKNDKASAELGVAIASVVIAVAALWS